MARTELEQLVYQMSADVTQLRKSQTDALGIVRKGTKDISDHMEEAGKGLWTKFLGHPAEVDKALESVFSKSRFAVLEEGGAKLGIYGSSLEMLGPAGLVAAAGLAAVAIAGERAREALEWADEIDRFSKTVGTSTSNLQAFDDANISTSVGLQKGRENLEEFSGVMAKFQAHIGDKKSTKWFDAIGLSREEIAGTSDTILQLEVVLEKVAGLGSQSTRVGALNALGLGQYKEIVADGTEGVEKYIAALRDAQTAGGIVSDADIAKAAELNDHVELMEHRVGQELKKAFLEAGPAVDAMATFFERCAREITHMVDIIPAAIGGVARFAHSIEPLVAFDGWLKGVKAQSDAHDEAVYQAAHDGKHPLSAMATEATRFIFGAPGKPGDAPSSVHDWLNGGRGYNYMTGAQDILAGRRKADWTGSDLDLDKRKSGRTPQLNFDKAEKGPKDRTDEIAAASDKEIAAATKAELEARLALVTDLDQRAAIQAQLLEQERAAAVQKIADDLKLGKITAAAAAKATALTNDTYAEKQQLAERQAAVLRLDQERAYTNDLRKYENEHLTRQAEIADTMEEWAQATRAAFAASQEKEAADFWGNIQKRLMSTGADHLTSEQAITEVSRENQRRADATAKSNDDIDRGLRQKKADFADALAGYLSSTLEIEASLANTAVERRVAERAILDIRQKQARQAIQDDIDNRVITPEVGRGKLAALAPLQAAENRQFDVQHLSPWEVWAKQGKDASADVGTSIQSAAVSAMDSLNDGIGDAIANGKSMGDVFKQVFADMEKALISYLLKQAEISAFGGGGFSLGSLFGGGPAGGAGGLQPADLVAGIPKFADGGVVQGAGGPRSDNVLAWLSPGEVVLSNSALDRLSHAAPGGSTTVVHQVLSFDLKGAVMTTDLLAQMNAMADQAAQNGATSGRDMAVQQIAKTRRNTLGG